jgi:hypothetical protein
MAAPTYGSTTASGGIGPQPTNGIVVQGCPKVQSLLIETVTNCYPGRLVKKGTADNQIVVNTAGGLCVGVLGYEQCQKKDRPATRDTIYGAVNAPVLSGACVTVLLMVAVSQTIVKGSKLVAAANGMVSLAPAAAPPVGSVPVTSTGAQPTIAGPIPTSGAIVAIAEESITTDGSTEGFVMATLER